MEGYALGSARPGSARHYVSCIQIFSSGRHELSVLLFRDNFTPTASFPSLRSTSFSSCFFLHDSGAPWRASPSPSPSQQTSPCKTTRTTSYTVRLESGDHGGNMNA